MKKLSIWKDEKKSLGFKKMNNKNQEALKYFEGAVKQAKKSTCERARCGSVIVKDGKIIAKGFNSPPAELESQRRCSNSKDSYHKKVTDKTCCVHAEQRAMIDALKNNSGLIKGADLYFIRIDKNGIKIPAEKPYCTICSKMALDLGIKNFILFHKQGIRVYDTQEYNDLSFGFRG